jgi:hypothetical protein
MAILLVSPAVVRWIAQDRRLASLRTGVFYETASLVGVITRPLMRATTAAAQRLRSSFPFGAPFGALFA